MLPDGYDYMRYEPWPERPPVDQSWAAALAEIRALPETDGDE